jgi:II/X family phage/plasmid replication protein
MQTNGLLLDWITLRQPLTMLPPSLQERLYQNMDLVACFRMVDGQPADINWESKRLNFEALRSDSDGLYFTCTYVGNVAYFYVGASPASLEHDCNVFGSLDIRSGAEALLARARRAFSCFLAPAEDWELCRLDITGNYALPDHASVKTALRTLLQTDSARRKATSSKNGGDTVLWSPTSDVQAGKAYHKGPHLRHLVKKAQIVLTDDVLELADRLLRLELKLGSRFFRHMKERRNHRFNGKHWLSITAEELALLHAEFFGPICDGVEVRDMGRVDALELIAAASGITLGRAKAAYATYRSIKECGIDEVKASMPERTFYRHKKYLIAAGYSDGDLMAGNVVQFKPIRIVLAQPVTCWDDLRRAA